MKKSSLLLSACGVYSNDPNYKHEKPIPTFSWMGGGCWRAKKCSSWKYLKQTATDPDLFFEGGGVGWYKGGGFWGENVWNISFSRHSNQANI